MMWCVMRQLLFCYFAIVHSLLRVNSAVFSEYYGWEDLLYISPAEVANFSH